MTTVQLRPENKYGLDEVLQGISKLENADLELFLQQVAQILAKRKAPSLPKVEADLMIKINAGYPLELRSRYAELEDKKLQQTISDEERKEMVGIANKFEEFDGRRLEALVTLAQLRNIPLVKLMSQLGLTPTANA